MEDVRTLVESYLAAWNETRPEHRRELIERVFSDGARYRDPLMDGQGHDGIDAMIAAAQAQFPQHTFRLKGEGDSYGEYVRFSWILESAQSHPEVHPVAGGSDFGVFHEGKLREVTGFLDALSGAAEAR